MSPKSLINPIPIFPVAHVFCATIAAATYGTYLDIEIAVGTFSPEIALPYWITVFPVILGF